MPTAAVWTITLAGMALLLVAGTQLDHRPRTAAVLIFAGGVPVVVGSIVLWARTGLFG